MTNSSKNTLEYFRRRNLQYQYVLLKWLAKAASLSRSAQEFDEGVKNGYPK